MKYYYSKLALFVLCCCMLSSCGIARRVIMAPVNIFSENEHDATENKNKSALAFARKPENSGKLELYVITYETAE